MALSNGQIFTLLDKLIEQTRFGNATWIPTDSEYEYEFNGSAASVRITSIDSDGLYPIGIAILNQDGNRVRYWVVEGRSENPSEEAFDNRARALWELVVSQTDPVSSLIRDLDAMPPF